MKRIISIVLVLCVVFSLTIVYSSAAANVSLSGPSTADNGSTITFSVQVGSSEGFTGFSASVNASSGLVVQSVSGCPSGWLNSSTNNTIAIAGSSAVKSTEIIIKCKITGNPGDTRTLSLSGTNSSDANGNDSACASPSKNVTISTPKSGNNNLSALKISGYTLSPAFSSSVTSYDIGKVPFDVKSVSIDATKADAGASVSVSGNSFAVGENYIKVNVTAANGSVKTYTVKVTREQDPNYVPTSDGSLKALTVSSGDLSPVFDTKTLEYVVYVPFETDKITVRAEAASQLAKGVENIEDKALEIGVNELDVVCTAEDDSKTTYKVYVVRMDEFGGVDTAGLPASVIKDKLEDTTAPEEKDPEPTTTPTEKQVLSLPIIIAIAIGCLILGFVIGALIFGRKPKAPKDPDDDGFDYELEDENPEIPMEFEDIQSDSSIVVNIEEEASIEDYLTDENEELPPPAAIVTPPVESKPVIGDIKVTFADLSSEEKIEDIHATEPPKDEDRAHVKYIDYDEYIESLEE